MADDSVIPSQPGPVGPVGQSASPISLQNVVNALNQNGRLLSLIEQAISSTLGGTLANGDIFVGNASNVATSVPVSGDATLSNTGSMTVVSVAHVTTGTLAVANGGTGSGSTAWNTYVPTITSGGGTLTTVTGAGRYKTLGKTVFFNVVIALTTNGSGTSSLIIPLPVGITAGANAQTLCGVDANLGVALAITMASGATSMSVFKYDGTYPGVSGHQYQINGVFESA